MSAPSAAARVVTGLARGSAHSDPSVRPVDHPADLVGDDGRVVGRQACRLRRDVPHRDFVADIGPVAGSRSSRGPPSCLATSRWG